MIDSFYRITALHNLGVKIHLHSFDYGRSPSEELSRICETIHFYPRKTGFLQQLSCLPYVVSSRKSNRLVKDLLNDDFPILFDGLHTAYPIDLPVLANRVKLVRVHNIEHSYYLTMARYEHHLVKKIYFLVEALRLKRFENILKKADLIFTVSNKEQGYFSKRYANSVFTPSFHPYESVNIIPGTGKYIIYHGDLSINENDRVVDMLIDEVLSKLSFSCIIAGKNPSNHLINKLSRYAHITLVQNPSKVEMDELIANAQVHLLPVLKNNGLKLKLLLALYRGRHCVVNEAMVEGTYLHELCHVVDSFPQMILTIRNLIKQPFTSEMIETRREILRKLYSNQVNAKKIIDEIENTTRKKALK
jgi:hypothetical protein